MLQRREREVVFKQAVIDKLTHENAILKRLKFAAQSEAFNPEQKSLLEETLDADLAAVAAEIEALEPGKPKGEKQPPKRQARCKSLRGARLWGKRWRARRVAGLSHWATL